MCRDGYLDKQRMGCSWQGLKGRVARDIGMGCKNWRDWWPSTPYSVFGGPYSLPCSILRCQLIQKGRVLPFGVPCVCSVAESGEGQPKRGQRKRAAEIGTMNGRTWQRMAMDGEAVCNLMSLGSLCHHARAVGQLFPSICFHK